jgi:hypothetical protein
MEVRNPEKDKVRIIVKDWDRFKHDDPVWSVPFYARFVFNNNNNNNENDENRIVL